MKMKNPNLNRNGSVYGAWQTEFGDWMIINGCVCCYLLIGENSAMLIDTAYGKGDFRYLVESITDLPVTVVNTHGHTDHSGGNDFFPVAYMAHGGEGAAKSIYNKKHPYPDYEIRFIEDGQIFDLGKREVEVITIGAHHKSSVALLDHKNRSLYTGDEVESQQVLLFDDEHTPARELIQRHLDTMLKLKARSDDYDRLIPAHNGAPISKAYIDDYIALSQKYLDGGIEPEETVAGFGMPTFLWGGDKKLSRIRYANASFIIRKQDK